jgi:hypothetical protein
MQSKDAKSLYSVDQGYTAADVSAGHCILNVRECASGRDSFCQPRDDGNLWMLDNLSRMELSFHKLPMKISGVTESMMYAGCSLSCFGGHIEGKKCA